MDEPVPFFRPEIGKAEIDEVLGVLRSGWLTTGPQVKRFEAAFAEAVSARHAIALNSCTAALHLSVRALGLRPGQGVLIPTLTFAATAEIIRYKGGVPVLVDCDPRSLNMDLADAERKLAAMARSGIASIPPGLHIVGVIPVHVGGLMMHMGEIADFASRHGLWIVEDAAHAFPAAWRPAAEEPWLCCGQGTSAVACFSFYANKTITTGEGGMAVTDDPDLADQMRMLSLHGLSHDAWSRYSGNGSWDYRILTPGYKYNLTDIAAALGIHQLARAEDMRRARERIALEYCERLAAVEEIELPPVDVLRVHAWHLFPLKLRLEMLKIDRDRFMLEMKEQGVSCSVHWRPLHLHPYYQEAFGWTAADLPVASSTWIRLVTLPLFSSMRRDEVDQVIRAVRAVCTRERRQRPVPAR